MLTAPESKLRTLAQFFDERQKEVVEEWETQAANLPGSSPEKGFVIAEHLPELVAEIIYDLRVRGEQAPAARPPRHGVPVLGNGFAIGEAIAEYHLVAAAFFAVAERWGHPLTAEVAGVVLLHVDVAVRTAVSIFVAQETVKLRLQEDEHLKFIVHDLRTPLQAASLLVEELAEVLDATASSEAMEIQLVLRRNLERIKELVQMVVESQATDSHTGNLFRPERRSFALRPLVQRALLDLQALARRQDIATSNEVPAALTVYADAGLIAQVLQNLLGNAFKYAPRGRVTVSASADDEAVTCVVRDTGVGIAPELLPRVFDKLTTDPMGGGTGLGLTIVKQIVGAHGGMVSVVSTLGAGATFRFTIPVAGKD